MSDPQSFNRYAYVQNDPVNFVEQCLSTSTLAGLSQHPLVFGSPPCTDAHLCGVASDWHRNQA
jgi:hypothetical protein